MGSLFRCNIDFVTERQKGNKTKDDEQYSEDIQTTSNDRKIETGGWGGVEGGVKIF